MRQMPTEKEYVALHPERIKNGKIYCECGAANLRYTGNAGYVCAVCNAMLFVAGNSMLHTTNAIETKPHQTEAA